MEKIFFLKKGDNGGSLILNRHPEIGSLHCVAKKNWVKPFYLCRDPTEEDGILC